MAGIQDPKAMLQDIETRVESYKKELDAGNAIDLSGFEDDVRTVCSAINDLPTDQAMTMQARLRDLNETLQSIAETLTNQRDALKAQLQGLDKQGEAHAAYRKVDNSVAPVQPEASSDAPSSDDDSETKA